MDEDSTEYFALLPIEIVENIISYLTPTERRAISQLSKKFLAASYHFPQDWKLKLEGAYLDNDHAPITIISSDRKFHEVTFENVRFGRGYHEFLESICKKVKVLTIHNLYNTMSSENTTDILLACRHIEELNLQGAIRVSWQRAVEIKERLKHIKSLKILGTLSYDENSHPEATIQLLLDCTSVESLDIANLDRRITPPTIHQMLYIHPTPLTTFRGSGEFFYFLDQCIRKGRVDYIETSKLEAITGTEFSIGCPYVRSLLNVLEHSRALKELNLTVANRVRLLRLLRSGLKLQRLSVGLVVVEQGIAIETEALEAQPELESYELKYQYSQDEDMPPEDQQQYQMPLVQATYPSLKSLQLMFYLSDRLWHTYKFPKLVTLELIHCRIDNDLLAKILSEVPLLEKLSLMQLKEVDIPIFVLLKHLNEVKLSHVDNFGSSLFSVPKESQNQLKSLELNFSKAVNNKSLERLVKSFPELTTLDISGCKGVKIDGLKVVDKYLKNLQRLFLNNFNVQYIKELCTLQFPLQQLRFLYVGNVMPNGGDSNDALTESELTRFFTRMSKLRVIHVGHSKVMLRDDNNLYNFSN